MNKIRLENGIRMITEYIPNYRSISLGVWVRTGSRNETADNNGISHFIEHMLFKGTNRYDVKQIAEAFDGLGGNVNAFTAKEYTCYYVKVLDEHLPAALDVLSSMFFDSLLDQGEMDKERNVIMEEISMYEDTPDDFVHDLIAEAAYGQHELAYPILGTEQSLASMTSEDLRQYMHNFYDRDHVVISAAGNVDEAAVETIKRYFDRQLPTSERRKLEAPQFVGDVRFHKKMTEQNHICLALPGLALGDKDLLPMVLLNNMIGGGMSSRLFQEIREKRGMAYSVYSYHTAQADSGMFTVYLGTAPRQTEEVLEVTAQVIADFLSEDSWESELTKGKEQMKGSLILGLESTSNRMNRLGKSELMLGHYETPEETIARIEAVTDEQLRQLSKRLFSQPFAVAMVGQSDKPLETFRRDSFVISSSN